jgi:hypothetical protein
MQSALYPFTSHQIPNTIPSRGHEPVQNLNKNMDARNSVVIVSDSLESQTVINLQAVQSVVGRVQQGKEWGIIDRSEEMARTVFVEDDDSE